MVIWRKQLHLHYENRNHTHIIAANSRLNDIINFNHVCVMKTPEQIIAEIEALKTCSPYTEFMASANIGTREAAQFSEIGRLGAIDLILIKLKIAFGMEITLSDNENP